MSEWIDIKHRKPLKAQTVDIWIVPREDYPAYRLTTMRYEWNGGTEGFWDWHFADESDTREGEPIQMWGIEPSQVTHWMPLPEPPK